MYIRCNIVYGHFIVIHLVMVTVFMQAALRTQPHLIGALQGIKLISLLQ